jgi:hypothetical protein
MRKVSPASVGTAPTTRQSVTKILNIADVSERLDFAANHDRSRRRISFSPRHSGEKLAKLSSRQGTTKGRQGSRDGNVAEGSNINYCRKFLPLLDGREACARISKCCGIKPYAKPFEVGRVLPWQR